jgi:hypothetical protein
LNDPDETNAEAHNVEAAGAAQCSSQKRSTCRWSFWTTEIIALTAGTLNFLAIVGVGVLAWHSANVARSSAEALQRGQNTISLLASFSEKDVDDARRSIASFISIQKNRITKRELLLDEQVKLYSEEFRPFIRQANLLAFCYTNKLCDEEFTISYACDGMVEIFTNLDRELPDLRPSLSELSESISTMLEDCIRRDGVGSKRKL